VYFQMLPVGVPSYDGTPSPSLKVWSFPDNASFL
jgi:hypothetical protein